MGDKEFEDTKFGGTLTMILFMFVLQYGPTQGRIQRGAIHQEEQGQAPKISISESIQWGFFQYPTIRRGDRRDPRAHQTIYPWS